MALYEETVASNSIFYFQREMQKYCQDDVNILRQACFKFKNLLDVIGRDCGVAINAFDSCTIAYLCINVFKQKHLTEEWKVKIFGDEEDRWLRAKKKIGNLLIEVAGQLIKEDSDLKILEEVFVKSPFARPSTSGGYTTKVKFSKKNRLSS